jgi:hypothetical protein
MTQEPERDWVGDAWTFGLAWGLPASILMAGALLAPPIRTVLWTGALLWAGAACLMNAKRCGRTHCRFTGPFFLVMAVITVLYGTGILWLGSNGWFVLALVIGFGFAALWWGSEAYFGKYWLPAK